jgi:hypothetical protein
VLGGSGEQVVTEAEWLASDDAQTMLALLQEGVWEPWPFSCACYLTECRRGGSLCPAYRKLRLFSCACCRQLLRWLSDPLCQKALVAAEQYADGALDGEPCSLASNEFDTKRRNRFPNYQRHEGEAWNALYCAVHRRWETYRDEAFAHRRWELAAAVARNAIAAAGPEMAGHTAALLRDVIGNPFRPVTVERNSVSSTALAIAQVAYEERLLPGGELGPACLAVLADALEEMGCNNADMLIHLRAPGPHVRGCWAVDLLLGKE